MAGRIRMTIGVRNLEGRKAALRARFQGKRDAIREEVAKLGHEHFDIAQGLSPRRTNYLANHMVLEFAQDGLSYFLGFLRGRFVGEVNPVTHQIVTRFYALDVIKGNSLRAGNDFLSAADFLFRATILARLRRAVNS